MAVLTFGAPVRIRT